MEQALSMELLRTFVVAAERLSFTRAGKVVHRTQSAVSMQMQRLEQSVGKPLFERKARALELTPAGEALLPHARRILAVHDQALADLSGPDLSGRVRLGLPVDYADSLLPGILGRFARRHPLVRVELRCDPSPVLLDELSQGRLDLVLANWSREEDWQGLEGEVVRREPLVWIGPRGGGLHEQRSLPLALFHPGCVYRERALQALKQAGRPYRVVCASPSLAAIWSAVRAGLGVAPLARCTAPRHLARAGLEPSGGVEVLGPEHNLPSLGRCVVGMHWGGNLEKPAVSALAQEVRQGFAESWSELGPELGPESNPGLSQGQEAEAAS